MQNLLRLSKNKTAVEERLINEIHSLLFVIVIYSASLYQMTILRPVL